jgi:Tol biopolymer transport system component
VTTVDPSRDETRHLFPQFLPGGKRFLFVAGSDKPGASQLYAQSLDSTQRVPVMPVESNVSFVPSPTGAARGWLVFVRGRVLMAAPFDSDRLRVTGPPFPLADSIMSSPTLGAQVSAADFSVEGSTLAYRGAAGFNILRDWNAAQRND